ncbi:MAG: dTMP kinase [Bacteroides sp.]|nr:dTMP kinase [Bacillota bacterium]MCM1393818.1 dTMP kinase [[Eubacterium] siraeum]MCM1455449.1 dTMP kinase [Bacteroides sp.]
MFVSFEGCEGVGKSTQLRLLKEYLERTGQPAVYVREPGSTEISEQIRKVILDTANVAMTNMTEALLYAASRAQLVREVIKPALKRGELVICDRYVDSSVAYQGYGREMGAELIRQINSPAIDGCLPDLTIFIDLSPEHSWRTYRTEDRLEQESNEFFNRVYGGFVSEIAASNGRIVAIKPEIDKYATSAKIIDAMRQRGIIK